MGDPDAASGLASLLQSSASLELRREAAACWCRLCQPGPIRARWSWQPWNAAGDDEIRDWAAVAALRLGEAAGHSRLLAIVARAEGASSHH